MMKKLSGLILLPLLVFLVACDDDESNSFIAKDEHPSSSSVESSSSVQSSSSLMSISGSSKIIKPSGTYDCSVYKCVTTEFLNQKMLEEGKYGEILDERDNQVYKTIQIGEQVWLAQNLNNVRSGFSSCCLDKQQSNCDKYGQLYTYKSPAYCPDGWRRASMGEWRELIDFAGDSTTAARKLASQRGWYDEGVDVSGTDDFGFSMAPAGMRLNSFDEFSSPGNHAVFLFSTGSPNSELMYTMSFHREYEDGEVKGYISNRSCINQFAAISIRCIKAK